MLCPDCDISLTPETLYGQIVDRCNKCDGVWFDESELGQVVRQINIPKLTGAEEKHGLQGIECPKCQSPMKLFNYAHDSGITINRCHTCSGAWLAKGQLQLICQYRVGTPAMEALEKAIAKDIRHANRWRLVRNVIRSRLLSGIVAIAYLLGTWLITGKAEAVFYMLRFLITPVVCIWFCAGIGHLTGIAFGVIRPRINQETPSDLVAIGAWILLLTPAVVMLFYL